MARITSDQTPTQDQPDTDQFLQQLADGDPQMWRHVTHRFRRIVWAAGTRLRLTHQETEDVEQHVWLLLWRHATAIRDQRCLPGWIATTARREAFAVLSRRRELPSADLPEEGAEYPRVLPIPAGRATAPAPPDILIAREGQTALFAAVGQLPPRQRDLIIALVLEELSYDEVNHRTGMPLGSIGPTRQRAIARLRESLNAEAS